MIPHYRLYPQVRFADVLQDACQAVEPVLARLTAAYRKLERIAPGAEGEALLTWSAFQ